MASFVDVVQSAANVYAAPDDIQHALRLFEDSAMLDLRSIPRLERARMVDRFVRNLHVSVHEMVDIQRHLLEVVDARPENDFHAELNDPRSVLTVRSQVKEVLTVLGHGWELLSRVQAAVCSLVRWLQSTGGGDLNISLNNRQAHFLVSAGALGKDVHLIETSPIVRSLKAEVSDFKVVEHDSELFLEFVINGT